MRSRFDSPIVGVQRIESEKGAGSYLTKYIGKGPGKFGTLKRYWHSKRYDLRPNDDPERQQIWERESITLDQWCDYCATFGWPVNRSGLYRAEAIVIAAADQGAAA